MLNAMARPKVLIPLLLCLGLGALYLRFGGEPEFSGAQAGRMSVAATFFAPQGDAGRANPDGSSKALAAVGEDDETEEEAAALASFSAVIRAFDLKEVGATPKAIDALKALAPDRILLARLFKIELETLNTKDPQQRDNLVWLANSLQGPELLAFWQDLALRQTPRFENEAAIRNPQQANLDSRAVDVEQLQAIRNLGLIGKGMAADTLVRIILRPDLSAHRILHREQAFVALQKASPELALKVLTQLKPDDELLQRIKSRPH